MAYEVEGPGPFTLADAMAGASHVLAAPNAGYGRRTRPEGARLPSTHPAAISESPCAPLRGLPSRENASYDEIGKKVGMAGTMGITGQIPKQPTRAARAGWLPRTVMPSRAGRIRRERRGRCRASAQIGGRRRAPWPSQRSAAATSSNCRSARPRGDVVVADDRDVARHREAEVVSDGVHRSDRQRIVFTNEDVGARISVRARQCRRTRSRASPILYWSTWMNGG